ncbi:hypothetical protein MMC29_007774 [Sticta canariensis]|nr:hypothetical protein [Sticta canariensis]
MDDVRTPSGTPVAFENEDEQVPREIGRPKSRRHLRSKHTRLEGTSSWVREGEALGPLGMMNRGNWMGDHHTSVCLLNDFGLLNSKRDAGTFTGLDQDSLTVSLCTPMIRIDLGDGAECAVQAAKKAHRPETNGFHRVKGILMVAICHEKSANRED